MSILRLGIIGVGNFAVKRHIPEILKINQKVKLVSICRRNLKNLKYIGELFKIKSLYTNHIEMLKSEKLDLVLIASSHSLHFQHTMDALSFNCHVVIEKPMTTSLKTSKKLIQYAKKKRRKIIPLYNPPFENHISVLKKIVSQKSSFGELEHANITWLDYKSPFFGKGKYLKSQIMDVMPTNFRLKKNLSAGGILFDSGCHLVAELIWILNKKPDYIISNFFKLDREINLSIIIIFKNSLRVTLSIIGASKFKSRRVESCYWGTKKTVRMTGKPYQKEIFNKHNKIIKTVKNFSRTQTPINEAVNHIKENKKLSISIDHSKIIISTIEAAYMSAKLGKKITVKY